MRRGRCAEEVGQRGQGVDGVLSAGGEEGGEDFQGMSAGPGPMAAEDLAVEHRGSNGWLGRPVGGFEVFLVQKGQQLATMLVPMIAKRAASRASGPQGQQAMETFLQSSAWHPTPLTNFGAGDGFSQ